MARFEIDQARKTPIYKKPKLLIPILIIGLLIVATILAVKNLNAPAEGTINQTPPLSAEKQDPYANPANYAGKYVSFTYPAHYKKVPTQVTGNYLEVVGFYATDQSGKQISVGVLKEGINEDSGVKLRRQQSNKYREQPRTQSGVVIFKSTASGNESTAYIPHGDKVATVSLTSPPGWNLDSDLQTVLSSLKWK
jgi:hypothetical protein